MRSRWSGTIVDIYRDTLPHWVVDFGCYAVTIRCKGSLPLPVQAKLKEIGLSLESIEPSSPQAEQLRRQHFAILDRVLDAGGGNSPFAEKTAAQAMHEFIAQYDFDGLQFDHWVVMPNHLHLITAPLTVSTKEEFKRHWKRFKALSAKHINQRLKSTGKFWQSSWYDRWIRTEEEHSRWQRYLNDNPGKAKLSDWDFKK